MVKKTTNAKKKKSDNPKSEFCFAVCFRPKSKQKKKFNPLSLCTSFATVYSNRSTPEITAHGARMHPNHQFNYVHQQTNSSTHLPRTPTLILSHLAPLSHPHPYANPVQM